MERDDDSSVNSSVARRGSGHNGHNDSWLKTVPIAHRGLHTNDERIPENSLGAFANALAMNFAIELDVFVGADNQVVVFHDDNLDRMCGIDKPVTALTKGDRQQLRLLRSAEKIPLLQEVTSLIDGKVPILIEIKRQRNALYANRLIWNAIKDYRGPVAVQSFDPFILGWFAKNAPSVCRGLVSSRFKDERMGFAKKYILRNMALNFISRPHFIAYDIRDLPNSIIENARKRGKPVLGWTVRDQNTQTQVESFCDNIIFEGFIPFGR